MERREIKMSGDIGPRVRAGNAGDYIRERDETDSDGAGVRM